MSIKLIITPPEKIDTKCVTKNIRLTENCSIRHKHICSSTGIV